MTEISATESEVNFGEQEGGDYFKVEKKIFFQEAPLYTREVNAGEVTIPNQLKASQGSGVIANEKTPIYSDNIANCFALILENEKSKKTALFHVDANFPTNINMEILNQISEGGGLVTVQAVRGSNSISSEATKQIFSEYLLVNVLIAEDIQVKTGSGFWSITYFPEKEEFCVQQEESKKTSKYMRQAKSRPIPETNSFTDKEKIVSTIVGDKNIDSYLRYPTHPSPDTIFDSVNTLATFISKDQSRWVDRWVLSSREEKQIMSNQIAQRLSSE